MPTMVDRSCERCSKAFQVQAWVAKVGKGRFCSRACINPPTKEAQCTCRTCGKEFWIKASAVESGRRGHFCSKKCQSRGYQPTAITGPGETLRRPLIIRERPA